MSYNEKMNEELQGRMQSISHELWAYLKVNLHPMVWELLALPEPEQKKFEPYFYLWANPLDSELKCCQSNGHDSLLMDGSRHKVRSFSGDSKEYIITHSKELLGVDLNEAANEKLGKVKAYIEENKWFSTSYGAYGVHLINVKNLQDIIHQLMWEPL